MGNSTEYVRLGSTVKPRVYGPYSVKLTLVMLGVEGRVGWGIMGRAK
jgi:hypothetical protein